MSVSKLKVGAALFCIPTTLLLSGCSYCKASPPRTAVTIQEVPKAALVCQDLPPNPKPGECYAKVFVPEQFGSKTETVLVRDASERLEIVPAKYEWVEEKVVAKEASSHLEIVPAQFETRQNKIQTDPGHAGWHIEKTVRCASDNDLQWANEMYCLRVNDPVYQTMDTQVQVKPATVREVVVPAEFQTVRRQKLVTPATTQRTAIPAEFASVQKTFKVADSRVEWRRVACETERRTETSDTDNARLTTYAPRPVKGD